MRPLRYNGSRHRIITTDSYTHEQTKAEDPDHLQRWRWYTIRQADDQNCADNANDEFLAVNKFPAESISKKTK